MNNYKKQPFLKKLVWYLLCATHLPWTLIRAILALTLILDLWCDKIHYGTMEKIDSEIENENQTKI